MKHTEASPLLGGGLTLNSDGVLSINESVGSPPMLHHVQSDEFAAHGGHGSGKVDSKYAIWNLFNDILSPGTVALPLYIAQSGLATGIILLFVFGFLTAFTLMEIHRMYIQYDKKNYPELCEYIYGKTGYGVVCAAIFCFNFGGLCGQLMLFGSAVPDLLSEIFGDHPDIFTKTNCILMGCVIFLPISFLKDIAKYTFTSFLSVSCIFIITGFIVFRLIFKAKGDYIDDSSSEPYAPVHISAFSALGGLAYIFVCHDLSFNVIGSLENATRPRYGRVVAITMAGTVASTGLIGICGYLLWYEEVKSNVLDNFPAHDTVATIARALLAIDVTATIPFTCFMPRISIIAVLSAIGPKPKAFAHHTIGFSIITVFVLASAVIIAIIVDNLGDVFELVGGVSACTLAFLLPPILVLKKVGLRKLTPFRKVMTLITLVSGVIILIGSTVDIFVS